MLSDAIRRIRKNHALEHATVAILLERGIKPPLGGYSTPGGFFIVGRVSTEILSATVTDAWDRMNQGQREMAISPHCGTNLATKVMLSTILFRVIMGKRKEGRLKRLPLALVGFAAGTALSRPVGNFIQRKFTTLAEVSEMQVWRITPVTPFLHRIYTR